MVILVREKMSQTLRGCVAFLHHGAVCRHLSHLTAVARPGRLRQPILVWRSSRGSSVAGSPAPNSPLAWLPVDEQFHVAAESMRGSQRATMNEHDAQHHAPSFNGRLEPLEPRIVFSVAAPQSPLATASVVAQVESLGQSTGSLSTQFARETYGLDGAGQTVVIIDSGIAYDHYALGGGLGTGFQVVGGWDFAENDADPYDDAPGGFHGTHLAGIVASNDAVHTGVAPGVDLVGLRVFDDHGRSSFEWIEAALQWVHRQRDALEHPITTVNLSVGTDFHGDAVPDWSQLEDELLQLEGDGIFVAVSAGNNFVVHQTVGLNYPAASLHVVPVASVDAVGQLSDFSQRHQRVLAAPGEDILSTVPDYLYGFDGTTDDFAAVSGTSMAAPYVAAASALVRQAMQAMGQSPIEQDDIEAVLRSTADAVYDPLTGANYLRVNLQAALAAIIPADDYGSTAASGYRFGAVQDQQTAGGSLNALTDVDYFSFAAAANGVVELDLDWLPGGAGQPGLQVNGHAFRSGDTFAVRAGQTYSFTVSAADTVGRYTARLQLTPDHSSAGPHSAMAAPAASAARHVWQADVDGSYELSVRFSAADQVSRLEVRDGDGRLLAGVSQPAATERFAVEAARGEQLQIDIRGTDSQATIEFVATEEAPLDGNPGGQATTVTFGHDFHTVDPARAHVDEALVEDSLPAEEVADDDVDKVLRGWQQVSELIESLAAERGDRSSADDEDRDDQPFVEVYTLSLDEALSDTVCWQR